MLEEPNKTAAVLAAECAALESHLQGELVYRQIRVRHEGKVTQHLMAIGSFLEHRAAWRNLDTEVRKRAARGSLDALVSGEDLLMTFEDKAKRLAGRECKSRLDGLSWNIESWSKENHLNVPLFATEMAQRSRLQRLKDEFDLEGYDVRLKGQDAAIRRMTREGPFIWRKEYEAAFPMEPYWFLYRIPI